MDLTPALCFEENDVSDPRHPLHPRLLEMLRDPIFRDPRVSMFNLSPLWEFANAPLSRLGEFSSIFRHEIVASVKLNGTGGLVGSARR